MERLKNRRILVTGGTGFVGSHVVEQLIGMGAQVIVPYRSIDPRSYFFSRNLSSKVILASCDLKDGQRVRDIVTKYEIEHIIHLGAQAIVGTAYHNPLETIETNILGTLHILEAARGYREVRSLIIASSDKAYGKSDKPYKETDALRGDHPYEVSKSSADLIALSYARTYDMPVIVTRFGNIYGPGDFNINRIIPGIMKTVVTGRSLDIRSNGKFVREYVYVKDVASAYIHLLKNSKKTKGEAFNISSGERYSVLALIKKTKDILKKELPYVIRNTQKNEIPEQSLDCRKIHEFGWKPSYTLGQGLEETYAWYKDYFSL